MATIAVLGGGSTGLTMAADLTLRGHTVRLYEHPAHSRHLREAEAAGGIRLTGRAATGFAAVSSFTEDLSAAVEGAEVILIAIIANRHEALVQELAPLLRDGQAVCFSTGNCGSILLRRALARPVDVVIGEMLGNVYPCRLTGPAQAKCALPYAPKRAAAFPGRDTPRLVARMEPAYPCVAAKNVLETALNSPGLTIHLAGSLLNTCAIEHDPEFRLYQQGLSPGVLACMRRVEEERALVLSKLGLGCVRHCGMIGRLLGQEPHPELDDFRAVAGPGSMTHRYISEDAFAGHALLLTLGRQLGLHLPCMAALETLASVINNVDYLSQGRTAEQLGLSGLSPEGIGRYLETGERV